MIKFISHIYCVSHESIYHKQKKSDIYIHIIKLNSYFAKSKNKKGKSI